MSSLAETMQNITAKTEIMPKKKLVKIVEMEEFHCVTVYVCGCLQAVWRCVWDISRSHTAHAMLICVAAVTVFYHIQLTQMSSA